MSATPKSESMLDAFSSRRGASEQRHATESEQRFLIEARRDRLLAGWAEGLLGRPAGSYASELIEADLKMPGEEDVVAKLLADLGAQGVVMTEAEIRQKLFEFETQARLSVSRPDAG
jgi:hypothetical protein